MKPEIGQKLSANVLFQCNDTTINTSMTSGIAIETGLVLLLSLLPIVEKSIGRMTNLGEDNAVLIFQSIIVAYIVKTCKHTMTFPTEVAPEVSLLNEKLSYWSNWCNDEPTTCCCCQLWLLELARNVSYFYKICLMLDKCISALKHVYE